jgi:RimJ/RimL family protein N-acetyltransferase
MKEMIFRRASVDDITSIVGLYSTAYHGHYPDPMFTNIEILSRVIDDHFLFVAQSADNHVVGCIHFLYSESSFLGKAGAAVVHPNFQGMHITQSLIQFGVDYLSKNTQGVDVLYATTRTVHKAAQVLTSQLGFKKLGIFPNVHKTEDFETHALASLFLNDCLKKRYTDFKQHPAVINLFNIAAKECSLPAMEVETDINFKNFDGKALNLEVIDAKLFVRHRLQKLIDENDIDLSFFPFHRPSVLISTPDQKVEVFCYVNDVDKHCVIAGLKLDREVDLADLLLKTSSILRDRGVRYIELIVRANRLNIITKFLKAKYLPCGYFPAFQKEDDKRYDYVVFSRSFEILDFNNIELEGHNKEYLNEYIKAWEEAFLGKKA